MRTSEKDQPLEGRTQRLLAAIRKGDFRKPAAGQRAFKARLARIRKLLKEHLAVAPDASLHLVELREGCERYLKYFSVLERPHATRNAVAWAVVQIDIELEHHMRYYLRSIRRPLKALLGGLYRQPRKGRRRLTKRRVS